MLRAFLLPILISLSCLLVQTLASRSRDVPAEDFPEFRFSKGLRLSLWFVFYALLSAPGVMILVDVRLRLADWLLLGGLELCGLAACLDTGRYVLKFWGDHLTYGSFTTSSIYYKDIVSAEMEYLGSWTLVIKTPTKRVKVSGYLSSVDDAAQLLKNKVREVRPAVL